jgi:hypothetical protein
LILDFDEQSAVESAEQDWKIDVEREAQERKQARKNQKLADIPESESEDESSAEEEQEERFMNEDEKA